MIALKKNDKLIIIIGIVILAVAVLAIALYQDPAQDNGGILFTHPSEDMYEIEPENWTAIKRKGRYLIIAFEAVSRESALNMLQATYDKLP